VRSAAFREGDDAVEAASVLQEDVDLDHVCHGAGA
jgi:hypothetical protein